MDESELDLMWKSRTSFSDSKVCDRCMSFDMAIRVDEDFGHFDLSLCLPP